MKFISYVRLLLGCLLVAQFMGACTNGGTEPTPTTAGLGRRCVVSALNYAIQAEAGSLAMSMAVNATLTYNAANQVSGITTKYVLTPGGSFSNTDEITYSPGKIEAKTKSTIADMDGITSTVYTLNSAGLITQRVQTLGQDGRVNTTTYEYDKDGYRIKETLDDGTSLTHAYTNGNLTTTTFYGKDGAKLDVLTATYYEDRQANTSTNGGLNAETAFYAAGLLGKPNRNPVKAITYQLHPNQNISFDYVYDADNNIVTVTQQGGSNPVAFKVNYAYTCR